MLKAFLGLKKLPGQAIHKETISPVLWYGQGQPLSYPLMVVRPLQVYKGGNRSSRGSDRTNTFRDVVLHMQIPFLKAAITFGAEVPMF